MSRRKLSNRAQEMYDTYKRMERVFRCEHFNWKEYEGWIQKAITEARNKVQSEKKKK